MCTYQLKFQMDAGLNDIMYIEFEELEGTLVSYAIGVSYSDSYGFTDKRLKKGNTLRLEYPNMLFLTMMNTK